MYLISVSQQTQVLLELKGISFLKSRPRLVQCIVGVNMFVEVTTEKFHLGLQKGLSITETEFAERAEVLDKTYLGNFMFVHTCIVCMR